MLSLLKQTLVNVTNVFASMTIAAACCVTMPTYVAAREPRIATVAPQDNTVVEDVITRNAPKEANPAAKDRTDTKPDASEQQTQTQEEDTQSTDTPAEENPSPKSLYARKAYFDYSAHDDGSITEWNPGFFIAHNWSEAGQIITATQVGGIIRLNDHDITICERHIVNEDMYYEDIRNMAGPDKVIFQTCADGPNNLLLFGKSDAFGPYDTFPEAPEPVYEEVYEESYEEPYEETYEETHVEAFVVAPLGENQGSSANGVL